MKRHISQIDPAVLKHIVIAAATMPRPNLTPRKVAAASQQPSNGAAGELTGPEQRILNAIAWLNSIGVEQPEQTAVAFLAGYTHGAGSWNNARGRVNQRGYVRYLGNRIELTDEGRQFAKAPDTPLDSEGLQRMVLTRLPGPERRILTALLPHPEGLANEELAQLAGYTHGAGSWNNARGRLRSLGLVEYQAGKVVPKSLLYLEGA